jgi:hypothetical protein
MGCVYRHGAHKIATPDIEADVVVARFAIKDCDVPTVIDDPVLWQHGAHAIYFDGDKMRVEYTRERRSMRSWSAGWKRVMLEEKSNDD